MSDLTVSNPVDTFMQAANQAAMRAATGIAAGSTLGDLIYFDGTSYVLRPATTDGFVLTLSSGIPVWAAAASGGVASLGGASGVLTLGTGLSMTGQALTLTNPFDPANVAITAGTINGTVIGGTTPAAGTFTSSTLTQDGLFAGALVLSGGYIASASSGGVVQIAGNSKVELKVSTTLIDITNGQFSANVSFFIGSVSTPSTPTGGAIIYSTGGQMHVLDTSAVDVNLSTLQADTGFAGPASNGDKSTSVTDYAGGGALFSLDAAADNQIKTLTSIVQAIVASLRSDKIPRS